MRSAAENAATEPEEFDSPTSLLLLFREKAHKFNRQGKNMIIEQVMRC